MSRQQQLKESGELRKFHALALTNPRMAAVRNTIVRDATREHMVMRALPGYRLRSKISTILQRRALRHEADEDPSHGARRGAEAGDAQQQDSVARSVDLSVYSEPAILARTRRRSEYDDPDGVARVGLLVRAVRDECAARRLDDVTVSFITDYVESSAETVTGHLQTLFRRRLQAQHREAQARLGGNEGHVHVFAGDAGSGKLDVRRGAKFPMQELRESSQRIVRCSNGSPALERPSSRAGAAGASPLALPPIPRLRADVAEASSDPEMVDEHNLPTAGMMLMNGATTKEEDDNRAGSQGSAITVPKRTASGGVPPRPTSSMTPAGLLAELTHRRNLDGGTPGLRLTSTAEKEMLAARTAGLSGAEVRGLSAIDGDPKLMPILPMPTHIALPSHNLSGANVASGSDQQSSSAATPTPATLASFLRALDDEGNAPAGSRRASAPPTMASGDELPALSEQLSASPRSLAASPASPTPLVRFKLDATAVASLLNNDAALIRAMVRVLDDTLGPLGAVPEDDGVEVKIAHALAPSGEAVARTDNGVNTKLAEQQRARSHQVATPVHALSAQELAALQGAVRRGSTDDAAAPEESLATDQPHSDDSPAAGRTHHLRNKTGSSRHDVDAADGDEGESDDGLPRGLVGDVLRGLGLSSLRSVLTAWMDHAEYEELIESASAAPIAVAKSSASTGGYEPRCIICQAAHAEREHEKRLSRMQRSPRLRKEIDPDLTDEEARRHVWRAMQSTSVITKSTGLQKALARRSQARERVAASGAQVSAVVQGALGRGKQWGLCRGEAPPTSSSTPHPHHHQQHDDDDDDAVRQPTTTVSESANARSQSTPPTLVGRGGGGRSRESSSPQQQLKREKRGASPASDGKQQRGHQHHHHGSGGASSGLWMRPSRDLESEAQRVAQCELFWQRFLVFCHSVGQPSSHEQQVAVEELRRTLLRTRRVSSALLLRWMGRCGPQLLEGREASKMLAFVRMELRVPAALITAWRRMPTQRAAGWHTAAQ